jgi:hypothetical protein
VLVDLGSEITLVPVEESTSGESESKADRNGEPNRVGHSLSTGKSNAHDMLRQATCAVTHGEVRRQADEPLDAGVGEANALRGQSDLEKGVALSGRGA